LSEYDSAPPAEGEIAPPPAEGQTAPAVPPPPGGYPPYPYQPAQQAASERHTGWLIAVGIVLALAVGALAAAIIAKGDDNSPGATVTPVRTVQGTTTVQQTTTTVTTPAPAITVAPDVTLAPSGSIGSPGDGTTSTAPSGAGTGTSSTPATTSTSP